MAWKKLFILKAEGGLGFRDFKCFNSTLLGKQGWRFLQHHGSLVDQLLRARYFPEGSFLDAELGNNQSYTWPGIWGACWVVQRGCSGVCGVTLISLYGRVPGYQARKVG